MSLTYLLLEIWWLLGDLKLHMWLPLHCNWTVGLQRASEMWQVGRSGRNARS